MTVNVFFDTRRLQHYRHSPNNYSHFLLGNLLELYIELAKRNLLQERLRLSSNNPTTAFADAYGIFGEYAGNVQAPVACDVEICPTADVSWEKGKATQISAHAKPFAQHCKKRLGIADEPPDTLTYIRRKPRALGRFMLNERQVIALLEEAACRHELNFDAVSFENETFASQVKLVSRSTVLIGLHGAGFANCVFCNPGTRIVELWPHPGFRHRKFRLLSGLLDLEYHRINALSLSVPNTLSVLRSALSFMKSNRNRMLRDRVVVADVDELCRETDLLLAPCGSSREGPRGQPSRDR